MEHIPGPFECGCQLVKVEERIYAGYDVGYVDKWEMKSCPLHAAAPDLLKAAKLAAECFDGEPCPLVHGDDDPCWLEFTYAAIVKATGA